MAEAEEPKKLESETPSDPPPAPATPATSSDKKPAVEEAPKEECKEKSEEKAPEPADESKAIAIVESIKFFLYLLILLSLWFCFHFC